MPNLFPNFRCARSIVRTLFAAACLLPIRIVVADPFTIVMLPDTQNYVDFTRQKAAGFALDGSELYLQQMRHIASKSVSNGGDVVFHPLAEAMHLAHSSAASSAFVEGHKARGFVRYFRKRAQGPLGRAAVTPFTPLIYAAALARPALWGVRGKRA